MFSLEAFDRLMTNTIILVRNFQSPNWVYMSTQYKFIFIDYSESGLLMKKFNFNLTLPATKWTEKI